LELFEYGENLSELRKNPFFLALKENKVERERLQKIKVADVRTRGQKAQVRISQNRHL
jgi:hypothetical protein